MPMRMIDKNCWVLLKRFTDKDGVQKTYLFCRSKQEGLPCPRDVKAGKKPNEICAACFENMTNEDFLNDVVLPDILERKEQDKIARPIISPPPTRPEELAKVN